MNKKGLSTVIIFLFLFAVFFAIVFLGLYVFVFNTIFTQLNIDEDIGQVNLGEVTRLTFGQLNSALLLNADLLGYTMIFALILFMFANAYLTRDKYPKLFIVVDIILLIFAYILSVYLSKSYSLLINSTDILSVYSTTLPKSSTFVLNLPKIVGIIGVIMMILSYSGIPRKKREVTTSFS